MSAGIGGSAGGSGGTITIYSGDVTVNANEYSNAIGNGKNGSDVSINIYGGNVNAIVANAQYSSYKAFSGTLTVGKDVQVYALAGTQSVDVDLTNETNVAPEGGGQVTTFTTSMFTRFTGVVSEPEPEPTGYTVTVNDGGVDTGNWTTDPAEATTTGVDAGTKVTVTYTGSKMVKNVKATKNTSEESVKLTHSADNTWSLTMPDGNVELEVTYYSEAAVTLNVTGGGGTAKLLGATFEPLKATDKVEVEDRFVLLVDRAEGYDFGVTQSTGGDPVVEEFTAEEYEDYLDYAQDFSGTYTIPAELEAGSTTSGDWTFKGIYTAHTWTEAPTGIYGFSAQAADGISQGQFVKVGTNVSIKPMRCYLEYKSGSEDYAGARGIKRAEQLPKTIKVRLISANGEVNAIGSLQMKTGEVTLDGDAWYSLDGRRLKGKPTTKGIYIINNNKVIIQ